jgi:hypothetical protein
MAGLVGQMRQVSAPGSQRLGGIYRLGDAQVRWVRPPPQRVQHQHVEPAQRLARLLGDLLHIGDVGQASEPVAEHTQMAVLKGEREDFDSSHHDWLARLGRVKAEPGLRCPLVGPHRIVEDVAERCADSLQRLGRPVHRQRQSPAHGENPEIVDPIDVVGVLVGVDHGVELGEAARKQLESELGGRVDENGGARILENGARPGAFVPLVIRATHRAGTPDLGHAE